MKKDVCGHPFLFYADGNIKIKLQELLEFLLL
jgi:hypothetical protein